LEAPASWTPGKKKFLIGLQSGRQAGVGVAALEKGSPGLLYDHELTYVSFETC
jgi:hypothetical protein